MFVKIRERLYMDKVDFTFFVIIISLLTTEFILIIINALFRL